MVPFLLLQGERDLYEVVLVDRVVGLEGVLESP